MCAVPVFLFYVLKTAGIFLILYRYTLILCWYSLILCAGYIKIVHIIDPFNRKEKEEDSEDRKE